MQCTLGEMKIMNPFTPPYRRYLLRGAVVLLGIVLVAGVFSYPYIKKLDTTIREKFDGKRWALPATVYARPLELFAGLDLSADMFESELQLGGYRRDQQLSAAGGYTRQGGQFSVVTRGFDYPSGFEPSVHLDITFTTGTISSLTEARSGKTVSLVRLDPARIGSFHLKENKDRLLLDSRDIPALLSSTLLTIEDQHFYSHHGFSPSGILRAFIANIRAGKTVQGGSTLTQQLVKNFFLNNDRTLSRKINEAVMAILLELHYSKDEILTAYANEIFLGQDGARAIHGFALASEFFFRRSLADLSPAQIATLVGMIKGPSLYDPRRRPEICLERRNVVLNIMHTRGIIDQQILDEALAAPLITSGPAIRGFNRFPAFLDLVRRQLRKEYHEEDLTSNGLRILTTLDPQVQLQVERQLARTLTGLETSHHIENLEGAVIISSRENGEILAIAGGKSPLEGGFNRALDAKRPLGSLIKPAVFLAALQHGYALETEVADIAVDWRDPQGNTWRPQNYDRKEHGLVPFYQALALSYNLATISIGREVGLENVLSTASLLGLPGDFPPFPSFLLGTAEVSPLDVAQMYQTLASGGFYVPQRAINSVLSPDGITLKRYGLTIQQRFSPELIFLINHCLQRVIREGTGKTLRRYLPEELAVAGKTGTTDDLRDSWFAGFTGDKLGIVWLGRDDNTPAGVTGSAGAMSVWGEIFKNLNPQRLDLVEPVGIVWQSRWDGDRIPLLGTISDAPHQSTVPAAVPPRVTVPRAKPQRPGFFQTLREWLN